MAVSSPDRTSLRAQFIAYLRARAMLVSVVSLFGVLLLLAAFTHVDLTPPCLFRTLTGIECLGCGLTTAFVHVIQFEWMRAWGANPLVVIVLPAACSYAVLDWVRFSSRSKSTDQR